MSKNLYTRLSQKTLSIEVFCTIASSILLSTNFVRKSMLFFFLRIYGKEFGMGHVVARPLHPQFVASQHTGLIVTVVTGICEMQCQWCITKQQRRNRIQQKQIPIDVITQGIKDLAPYTELFSIQGDELGQRQTFTDAYEMLECAAKHDIRTSCVTSGFNFDEIAGSLGELGTSVMLSMDGTLSLHVATRRRYTANDTRHTHGQTITALEHGLEAFIQEASRDLICVNTLLRLETKRALFHLPEFLYMLGIRHWAGTPQVIAATQTSPTRFKHDPQEIFDLALTLDARAREIGMLGLMFMDELGGIGKELTPPELNVFTLARPDLLIRIDDMTHQVAIGADEVSAMNVAPWDYRSESLAEHIVRRLGSNLPVPYANAA